MAAAGKTLGRSGLEIAPLVLGGNVFGWTADREASFRILDAALDLGLDTIDTADVYSIFVEGNHGGESETLLGEWMATRGVRDRVVLLTKGGMSMGAGKEGLSARYLKEAVDASLRRLRTDRIDLYQVHKDDPDTPQEETLGALAELVKVGKVRAIGASNFSAERLRSALDISRRDGLPRYESLQPLYNLVARKAYEPELEPLLVAEQVGSIPYFSLAAGFLTGKYRSEADLGQSTRGGGAKRYLNPFGLGVLAALDETAGAHGATPAQVALAWLMARPSVTAPIASATSPEQLADIAKAVELELTAQDVARLDAASDPAKAG